MMRKRKKTIHCTMRPSHQLCLLRLLFVEDKEDGDNDEAKVGNGFSSSKQEAEEGRMVKTSANDNKRIPDDELPWQVITLLDSSVLKD